MSNDFNSPSELKLIQKRVGEWLQSELAKDLVIKSVDYDQEESRWYVRVSGEEKQNYMILITLGQRTLHFETYVMPAPEENEAKFYEHILRRNQKLHGIFFLIGDENALYLSGELQNEWITKKNLDWIIGSMYAAIELTFKAALRIGFASRFH